MKKLIVLLISISMLVCMSACGKLPEGMPQELYDTSVKALEIMDKYNNADINAEEAYGKLEAIDNKIGNMNLSDSEYVQAVSIQSTISSYQVAIICNKSKYATKENYTIADELRETLELD